MHPFVDLPSDQQPREVVTGHQCPYCGGVPMLTDSIAVYQRSYGMIYLCEKCSAWVGLHKGKKNHGQALGRLANKELRAWKQKAHAKFDSMWRLSKKKNARTNAYAWLGAQMNLRPSRTHIGMFNVEQCKRAIELCDTLLQSLSRPKV